MELTRHHVNPRFVVRGALDRPVHARQWYERPGRSDGGPEVWCYTDRLSYAPGETVAVHASATTPRLRLQVAPALSPDQILATIPADLSWSETPDDASVRGCGWPVVAEFRVDPHWPSGAYRLSAAPSGDHSPDDRYDHLFIVRPDRPPQSSRLLLITSDATWTAYNDWGGSNHYEGIVDPGSALFSPRLSAHRPFARGLVTLPPEAPRTVPECPPEIGAPITYPHMDWAWDNGYSKKYASAGWASYEQHFAQWAMAEGYPCDVATQLDLHLRPEILDGYACVAIVGHDEYWSWQMRDAIDRYVADGGRVARFAGNFLWQIRLEDEGQTQVCYKYHARRQDPFFSSPDRHLTTTCWDDPEIARPAHSTFGLDALQGMYAGWGGLARHGSGGFTLYRPEHWAFDATGLGYGDVLGAGARVFGYEIDGLAHTIDDGRPIPIPCATLPDDLQILALSPARMREDGCGDNDHPLFVGDDDARYTAEIIHGETTDEAVARTDRGSGMIVHFRKGRGEVFHAGTTEWVAGLMRRDSGVVRVTRNVLNRFLSR